MCIIRTHLVFWLLSMRWVLMVLRFVLNGNVVVVTPTQCNGWFCECEFYPRLFTFTPSTSSVFILWNGKMNTDATSILIHNLPTIEIQFDPMRVNFIFFFLSTNFPIATQVVVVVVSVKLFLSLSLSLNNFYFPFFRSSLCGVALGRFNLMTTFVNNE